jgi:hypothetical protein
MGRISNDKKKELLIENFEVLREDPLKNDEGLCKIIQKMLKSIGDYNIGLEMLKWVIMNSKNPKKCIEFNEYVDDENADLNLAFSGFLLDPEVKKALAKLYKNAEDSRATPFGYQYIITTLFRHKKYDEAYNILSYYVEYFKLEKEWGGFEWGQVDLLKSTINQMEQEFGDDIDEQMVEVLLSCIGKIKDKGFRSTLTTMLIDYM